MDLAAQEHGFLKRVPERDHAVPVIAKDAEGRDVEHQAGCDFDVRSDESRADGAKDVTVGKGEDVTA